MIITFIFADQPQEWNTSNWRCVIPFNAVNRTSQHKAFLYSLKDFVNNTPEIQIACSQSDIIVVERNLFRETLTMIQYWKARGKVIVANFDDAYHLMHPSVSSYRFWHEGEVSVQDSNGVNSTARLDSIPLTEFKWGLRMVDAAVMPSKVLAKDWEDYTDTYYLPNYFPTDIYLKTDPAEAHEGIHIGWGGSLSHLQSFTDSGVLSALKRVLRVKPLVHLLICGHKGVYDKIDLEEGQKIYQNFVSFPEWPGVLRQFDIGLAPLHGLYDGRRSWNKPMEYMIMQIPWLASDSIAYRDIAQFGRVVKNTPKAWEAALMDMIDQLEDYRKKAQGEPYQFALRQGMDENVGAMLKIYADIFQKATGKEILV